MSAAYERGDWVRFYSGGHLVIGVVEYVRPTVGGYAELCTDQGTVREDYVLESRAGAAEEGGR